MFYPLIVILSVFALIVIVRRLWPLNFTMPSIAISTTTVKYIVWGGAAILGIFLLVIAWNYLANSDAFDIGFAIILVAIVALAIAAFLKIGGALVKIALVILLVSILIFGEKAPIVWKKVQSRATNAVLEQPTAKVAEQVIPKEVARVRTRVVHQNFTVSPGTTVLYKKHRCYVDNLTKQEMQHVVRFEKGDHVLFVSNHPGTIQARIWFFDEGGYCIEDFAKLRAQQAFQ